MQYRDGVLAGQCNIINNYSDARKQQTTGDELFEITFKKDDKYYLHLQQKIDGFDALTTNLGKSGKMEKKMEIHPDLLKKYKLGKRMSFWGAISTGAGIGILLNASDDDAMIIGAGASCIGGLTLLIGAFNQHSAVYEHNKRLRNEANLNFGITSSGGLGFVLNF